MLSLMIILSITIATLIIFIVRAYLKAQHLNLKNRQLSTTDNTTSKHHRGRSRTVLSTFRAMDQNNSRNSTPQRRNAQTIASASVTSITSPELSSISRQLMFSSPKQQLQQQQQLQQASRISKSQQGNVVASEMYHHQQQKPVVPTSTIALPQHMESSGGAPQKIIQLTKDILLVEMETEEDSHNNNDNAASDLSNISSTTLNESSLHHTSDSEEGVRSILRKGVKRPLSTEDKEEPSSKKRVIFKESKDFDRRRNDTIGVKRNRDGDDIVVPLTPQGSSFSRNTEKRFKSDSLVPIIDFSTTDEDMNDADDDTKSKPVQSETPVEVMHLEEEPLNHSAENDDTSSARVVVNPLADLSSTFLADKPTNIRKRINFKTPKGVRSQKRLLRNAEDINARKNLPEIIMIVTAEPKKDQEVSKEPVASSAVPTTTTPNELKSQPEITFSTFTAPAAESESTKPAHDMSSFSFDTAPVASDDSKSPSGGFTFTAEKTEEKPKEDDKKPAFSFGVNSESSKVVETKPFAFDSPISFTAEEPKVDTAKTTKDTPSLSFTPANTEDHKGNTNLPSFSFAPVQDTAKSSSNDTQTISFSFGEQEKEEKPLSFNFPSNTTADQPKTDAVTSTASTSFTFADTSNNKPGVTPAASSTSDAQPAAFSFSGFSTSGSTTSTATSNGTTESINFFTNVSSNGSNEVKEQNNPGFFDFGAPSSTATTTTPTTATFSFGEEKKDSGSGFSFGTGSGTANSTNNFAFSASTDAPKAEFSTTSTSGDNAFTFGNVEPAKTDGFSFQTSAATTQPVSGSNAFNFNPTPTSPLATSASFTAPPQAMSNNPFSNAFGAPSSSTTSTMTSAIGSNQSSTFTFGAAPTTVASPVSFSFGNPPPTTPTSATTPTPFSFGQPSINTSDMNPFGAPTSTTTSTSSNPFGAATTVSNTPPSFSFGGAMNANSSGPSTFGANPFAATASTTGMAPFGQSTNQPTGFGGSFGQTSNPPSTPPSNPFAKFSGGTDSQFGFGTPLVSNSTPPQNSFAFGGSTTTPPTNLFNAAPNSANSGGARTFRPRRSAGKRKI